EATGLARFRPDIRQPTAGQTAWDRSQRRDRAEVDDRGRHVAEQVATAGRGPVRYLVRMIDDATSWSWGRFVERDATPHNMGVLWEYLEKNGRMVDVYTDRDSMFTVPPRDGESKDKQRAADRLTQLGRALRELGIGSILAYSPQAKGRIERSFLTAQDRLVKHLRL